MSIRNKKTGRINTPNYKTLELLSSPNYKSFLLFATIGLLAFGSSHAMADDAVDTTNLGARAPIPSTSQQNQNADAILSIARGSRTDTDYNVHSVVDRPRVQEDPDAGSRVMPREKPVSYFKRDAAPNGLPKR